MADAPRILSLDEICKRVDRYADQWLAGRDVKPDNDLEHSIAEHGLGYAEILIECAKRERRRPSLEARSP
jgi:hypothetical protein